MTLSLSSVRPATAGEWDLHWRRCDYATYFHSRDWAEVWEAYSRGTIRPDARLVTFSDGARAVLALSSSDSLRGLVRHHVLSPAGTFGGWISADQLSESHVRLLVRHLLNDLGDLTWVINPYEPHAAKLRPRGATEDETHVLDLSAGFETVLRRWSKGHRSAARSAVRQGISVIVASERDHWRGYYDVYQDSLHRWGAKATSRYEWELFDNLYGRPLESVKLWLAVHEGRIVSGSLCFYAKRHAVYWHGASLGSHFSLRPANLVLHEAIRDACERGYTWFDFNPSGGHRGVRDFKKSFGATALSCAVVRSEKTSSRLLRRLRALVPTALLR